MGGRDSRSKDVARFERGAGLVVIMSSVVVLIVLGALLAGHILPSPLLWISVGCAVLTGLTALIWLRRALKQESNSLPYPPRVSTPEGADQESLRHLFASQEEERARIARELHDQIGQLLTALKYHVETLEATWHNERTISEESLRAAKSILDQGFDEIHRIVFHLRPQILDGLGLVPAIQWYAREFLEKTGLSVRLRLGSVGKIGEEKEVALFRAFQEACTNVIRHANAAEVCVSVKAEPGRISLEIEDNGEGFDAHRWRVQGCGEVGVGLRSMCERVRLLGGVCSVESERGQGTRVAVTIPI